MDWKLEVVHLPVADVDRSIDFYVGRLGWNLDHDHRVTDDLRFVQVTGPGSGCSITIGRGLTPEDQQPIRTLQVVVPDVDAAHAHLTERGIDCSPVDDQQWGSFTYFADPDGNAWIVQQISPRAA